VSANRRAPTGSTCTINSTAPGTHFTCCTGTKVQILTQKATLYRSSPAVGALLYYGWFLVGFFILLNLFFVILNGALEEARRGAHFACFTSTKVQILTPEELQPYRA